MLNILSSKFINIFFLKKVEFLFYFIWHQLWFELLDLTLSCLILTTHEKEHANKKFFIVNFLKFIFLSILTLFVTPFGIFFYIIWFFLFRKLFRDQPYQISERYIYENESSIIKNKTEFEIFSMNVCLLPDTCARLNNLFYTNNRLEAIGKLLIKSDTNKFCSSGSLKNTNKSLLKYDLRNVETNSHSKKIYSKAMLNDYENYFKSDLNIDIIDDFIQNTDLDFICMQEVWTINKAKKLNDLLHKKYPYIIYDAGVNTFFKNRYIGFESGLIIASKYPILNANFKQYSNCSGSCSLTSKGLLTIKVSLGRTINGKKIIGYVSNCHLQAYQKTSNIHSTQLEEIRVWTREFKEKSFNPRNETIAFDMICGDFNIDNLSPVDKISYEHQLFNEYQDPLSLKPGLDHPCAIGTELRQISIYDSWTSTPDKFRRVLENDRARRMFIIDSNIESATEEMCHIIPELDNDGLPYHLPKNGGNRRVDRNINIKIFNFNLE